MNIGVEDWQPRYLLRGPPEDDSSLALHTGLYGGTIHGLCQQPLHRNRSVEAHRRKPSGREENPGAANITDLLLAPRAIILGAYSSWHGAAFHVLNVQGLGNRLDGPGVG